jgi:Holliday junction resolvase RusA-like endonuclease
VNNLFATSKDGHRFKTKHYKFWLAEAGWRLRAQRPRKVCGPVVILLAVERSWDTADIDNRVKAVFDFLVKHDVMDDDSNVVGFAVAWSPPGDDDCRVLIMPARSFNAFFQLTEDGRHGGWFLETEPQGAPTDGD